MADSPVLYVYYRPDNDDSYPGVPNRHITEADWARFSPSQRRTVEEATTQDGYTRRKVWVHIDLVDETEQERAEREAAEQAAREAYERGQSIVRWRDFEPLVPGPGEVIVGGANGSMPVGLPALGLTRRPVRLVAFGDSITAGDSTIWGNGARSWIAWAEAIALQNFRLVANAGISGNRTIQMLSRIDADVIAHRPDMCIVLAGVNDLQDGIAQEVVRARLQGIYERLMAAGIVPILCSLTPRAESFHPAIRSLSMWIEGYAARNNLPYVDFYNLTADPATGDFRTGWSDDSLHPNQRGAYEMGRLVVDVLFGGRPPRPASYLPSSNVDPVNLLQNGLMLVDTNADGAPNDWSTPVANTTLEPATDVKGNWAVISGTGSISFTQTVPIPEGHVVEVSGMIKTSGIEAGAGKWYPQALWVGETISPHLPLGTNVEIDVPDAVMFRLQLPPRPSNRTELMVGMRLRSGQGTVKLAQVGLRDLTELGLA